MSWIDKELRRRQKQKARGPNPTSVSVAPSELADENAQIAALWERLEAAFAELPPELSLPRTTPAASYDSDWSGAQLLFRASNGAGIGFTGSAIRYIWPQRRLRKSNNFWIKSNGAGGYVVSRRVKSSQPGLTMQDRAFRDDAVEHIVKCLVTNRQVTWRSVTRRAFLFF